MESFPTAAIWDTVSCMSPFLLSLLSFFLLREQLTYLRKKSHLPGPSLVLPFVGTVFSLVGDPTSYWFKQARYAKSAPLGLSANYIIGRFIVFIRSSDLTHRVFANVRPDAFNFVGHPFGKKLFGEHNMIYLSGQPHKDIRRRIAPNFTPKALATYADIQQRVILKHLFSWEKKLSDNNTPLKLRPLLRDMNLETSQTVFAGPYLDQAARDRFSSDYNVFNLGTMTLPIDLPGFAFWKARKAVDRLSAVLGSCAAESKDRMAAGFEPTCLTDYWMQDAVREEREAATAGGSVSPPLPSCSEVGGHMFDFLFAAQDASTSSLLWAVALLDSHPEVLAKVRAEVAAIWSPESGRLITVEQLSSMKYTQAVTREVLRYRAPATMVPHIAGEDFPITETYTIPKGTIVFPSVFESSFQGFPEPDRFDPERFIGAREEDVVFKRNYLVFGAGSHQCVGQRYAVNLLVLFIAVFTAVIDFRRHRTDGCDEIVYTPTISPKDGCTVFISRRVAQHPNFKLEVV